MDETALPAWLHEDGALKHWMAHDGARAMWNDKDVLPAGAEVYYEDRHGNRLYLTVEHSAFLVTGEPAPPHVEPVPGASPGRTATVLKATRWEPRRHP